MALPETIFWFQTGVFAYSDWTRDTSHATNRRNYSLFSYSILKSPMFCIRLYWTDIKSYAYVPPEILLTSLAELKFGSYLNLLAVVLKNL